MKNYNQRLPCISLTRSELNSDLVKQDHPRQLVVTFKVTPRATAIKPAEKLSISNVLGKPQATTRTAVSLSLAKIATFARNKFSPKDLHVFAVLGKILRSKICEDLDSEATYCYDTSLLIYQDVLPNHYRISVKALNQEFGVLARLPFERHLQ